MYLVYIAAGMSSRFGGVPKLLTKIGINDESLIEISISQALTCKSINKIHFLVNKNNYKLIHQHIGDIYKEIPVTYSYQEIPENRDKPWGTADSIACLKNVINEPFIMCNSDDLYGCNAFKGLLDDGHNIIVGYLLKNCLPETGRVNRGIINVSRDFIVEDFEEKLSIEKSDFTDKQLDDTLVSMNLFKFQPDTIDLFYNEMTSFKKENKENKTIEALLPKFLNNFIKTSKIDIFLKICGEKCIGITYQNDVEKVKKMID